MAGVMEAPVIKGTIPQQIHIKAYEKALQSFPYSPFQTVFVDVGCKMV